MQTVHADPSRGPQAEGDPMVARPGNGIASSHRPLIEGGLIEAEAKGMGWIARARTQTTHFGDDDHDDVMMMMMEDDLHLPWQSEMRSLALLAAHPFLNIFILQGEKAEIPSPGTTTDPQDDEDE
uniref:Uncharacterized protein n=1 Tax=Globodera rostochiensis TaxID=31243 RepID=A0A914IAD2_GLORO